MFEEIRWLQSHGINIWFDAGIGTGSEWSESIARAIKQCSHFIYFITPRSVASENCRREVNFALEEHRTVLAAYLEETGLPDGLRLHLNNRQSLHRRDSASFRSSLLQSLGHPHLHSADPPTLASNVSARADGKHLAVFAIVAAAIAASLVYFFAPAGSESTSDLPSSLTAGLDTATAPRILRRSDYTRFAVLPTERLTDDEQTRVLSSTFLELLSEYYATRKYEVVSVSENDRELTPQEIGDKYGAGYVLYPNISHDGDEFRLTARITETINGTDIHGPTITATGETVSDVRRRFADDIYVFEDAVGSAEMERIMAIPVDQLNAFELMFAPALDRDTRAAMLEDAIKKDPSAAVPISYLANHYWWDVVIQHSDDVELDRKQALELARRGFRLDPSDLWTMVVLMRVERSFGQSTRATGYAEKLLTNKRLLWGDPYLVLIAEGRLDAVLQHAKQNPVSHYGPLARANILLGDYEEAEANAREALLTPDQLESPQYWFLLADALGHQGRIEEGRNIIDGLLERRPRILEAYIRGQMFYWGDDHTHLKWFGGIEKLGYKIPTVEVVH